ncbi:MAG: cell division protein FtsZ [Bdellovibrionota bacterium]|nr:MAG: cell division protein FtsZ [Bdellovibrionota bacterium]
MDEVKGKTTGDIKARLQANNAVIKVFGIGGAGVNAVNNMIRSGLEGVEFFAGNTDAQALASSEAKNRIQLGNEITKGLGAGADPDVGYAAAQESIEEIRRTIEGADMVFITAGMGGGTGTLGSSVIAQVAREMGCLTVGVVTKPFLFEGKRRMRNAERGIDQLKQHVDTLITIPNQRLLSIAGRNTSLLDTFRKADDILYQAVKGISDLIIYEGLVNVDFADVRAVMSEMGMAMMGTGESSGENRAIEAAEKAVSSPLLEDISIHGARGVLINITASPDVTLQEVNEAAELIHAEAHEDANIIWGMVIDPNLDDRVRVTVIATGFGAIAEDETTVSMASVAASSGIGGKDSSPEKLEIPTFARKPKDGGEVIKLKKLSVLSSSEDEEKYEIPTFLRKQVD